MKQLSGTSVDPRHRHLAAVSVGVMLLQLVLVSITLPFGALFDDRTLFHIDNAFHLYNVTTGVALAQSGQVVGYDPFFAAGHMNGVHYNFSARLPTLLSVMMSGLATPTQVYEWYVFGASVMAPVALVLWASSLGLRPLEALGTGLLGLGLWWASYFRWYFTAGMVSYVVACYLAILLSVWVHRSVLDKRSLKVFLGLGMLGALGFFLHTLFPVLMAAMLLPLFWIDRRSVLSLHAGAALGVFAAVSLIPNLFWIAATLQYSIPSAGNETQVAVDIPRIGRELVGLLREDSQGAKIYPLLFAGALLSVSPIETWSRRRVWSAMLAGWALLELFAYGAAIVPALRALQPNRFAPAGYLFLCAPAAAGLLALARASFTSVRSRVRIMQRATIVALSALSLVVAVEVYREVAPGSHGRYGAAPPMATLLGEVSSSVLTYLRSQQHDDSRVLFETSLARVHDHAHMAGLLAMRSGREFIGGPYPWMFVASAWDGTFFRRPIGELSHETMRQYLGLYNIGTIIVHSKAAKAYFSTMPGIRAVAERFGLAAFEVEGPRDYFYRGSGRIAKRSINSVTVSEVSGRDIVLKYHFVEGMVAEPAARIEPIILHGDAEPFVRIIDPPKTLRLTVR